MSPDSRPRVVLLGASNVTLALRPIVEIARGVHDGPLEILAAHGHGRSFGTWSRAFFVRDLPGIGACGLWRALDLRRAPETFALVTDVGNDLAYGRRVDEILAWVARDVDRLLAIGARIAITRLPISSLNTLTPWRFRIVQSFLFPGRRLELATMLDRARELDERLLGLMTARGIAMFSPRSAWYGHDPIHVRASLRRSAFAEVLAQWQPCCAEKALTAREWRALRGSKPELRRFFGRTQSRAQPCVRFEDGSTFAEY
jgi:hypothetical protein